MTALGEIRLRRAYFSCPACGLGEYALDGPLGAAGLLSRAARRLVCFFGGQGSFARAQQSLQEALGWSVSDETIRLACYREAGRIQEWHQAEELAYQAFLKAAGEIEFETDAAKVNTTEGWRDVKIGIFAKRQRGEKATPQEWDSRELPRPTARVAFARVEHVEAFGQRCSDWAERLRVVDTGAVSVLGDGAGWIWDLAEQHLPGAQGLVDIYHACERLDTAAKAVHGEQAEAAERWLDEARQKLLADGWWGLCAQVGQTLTELGEPARPAMEELLGYFSKHLGRLNYCARLYAGRSIGSGMVEGAAKNLIGKRLKQTKARWKLGNVQKMAALCCCTYSDSWAHYWTAA
jgi:hypothetical protein